MKDPWCEWAAPSSRQFGLVGSVSWTRTSSGSSRIWHPAAPRCEQLCAALVCLSQENLSLVHSAIEPSFGAALQLKLSPSPHRVSGVRVIVGVSSPPAVQLGCRKSPGGPQRLSSEPLQIRNETDFFLALSEVCLATGRPFDLMEAWSPQGCSRSNPFHSALMESDEWVEASQSWTKELELEGWQVCDSNGSEYLCSSDISVFTFLMIWSGFGLLLDYSVYWTSIFYFTNVKKQMAYV